MANPNTTIQVTAETEYLEAFLAQLRSELADASPEVRDLALDLLNRPSELIDFESRPASGASVAVLLKPSQRLLDIRAAVRTGDFDGFVVEKAHGDAPD